ncbi:MAG: GMC family oxidoreductase N-terminal domain-containing protein [Rubrobacter sp.]|nr:GMC family oxidoreductase N-terminal domain-containing protein [Rubrobacter sp.]
MTGSRFDYVVVGGGTAGAVVAARLAEDPEVTVCLLEAGPSDEGVREVLELRGWQGLLGSEEYGYDFEIEAQPQGNGDILHSRGTMLGGSSSHNSAIAFRPLDGDLRRWEEAGAAGWGPEGLGSYFEKVSRKVNMESSGAGNATVRAFIEAGKEAGFPEISFAEGVREGTGLFQLNKKGGLRQSSSVAYLHPLSGMPENLTVLTGARARRLLFEGGRAVGVETSRGTVRAGEEVVLCCGAFDSPKLLLLSGVGPAEQLQGLGLPVVADLPGVGENLLDHPEGVVMWESSRPVPEATSNFYEAGMFARVDPGADDPALMFHFGTQAFDLHTLPKGYPTAENAFSITPNVTRARSRGTVRLRSADHTVPPRIDFRYFTDPDGYDERIMTEGVNLARELAAQPALSEWVERELAPGAGVKGYREVSEYVRRTANTVYHPAGTCKMGSSEDHGSVVDPSLRVRGIEGLRVADASVFPVMISVNPCITCMMVGEKCADLIRGRAPAGASHGTSEA